MKTQRCAWVDDRDPLMVLYHDTEWGVPVYDDRKLFECIVLESAQAGLSWRTILHRRDGYRRAFRGFDPNKVATMREKHIERLMHDASIIRNRAKIRATITNAKAFLKVADEFGSFAAYMWAWQPNLQGRDQKRIALRDIPTTTPLAEAMSKDLKKRGFVFLGPTVWYAHMQAVGMVNDHTTSCFRHSVIKKLIHKD